MTAPRRMRDPAAAEAPRPVLRLGPPPRPRVRRTPRTPPHRPPAPQDRRHRRRHHRPHRPHGALKAARLDTGETPPPAKPAGSPAAPRSSPPCSAPGPSHSTSAASPAVQRSPAPRQGLTTHHLRRRRLRTPLRLVRAPPPQPLGRGGRTDLANAVPLCHRHHQWIHDTGFNHQPMPDGSSDSAGERDMDPAAPIRMRRLLRMPVTSSGRRRPSLPGPGRRRPVEPSVRKIDLL